MSTGTLQAAVVIVTKTVISSPSISVRPRTPSTTATNNALDLLDLSTLSPSQTLAEPTKLKNDHDAAAARKQLFGTARTARPADVALIRSCDSKALPMIIASDDNGHSMMAALSMNSCHVVKRLSRGRTRRTSFSKRYCPTVLLLEARRLTFLSTSPRLPKIISMLSVLLAGPLMFRKRSHKTATASNSLPRSF